VLKGLLRKFGVVRIDYENDWFALLTIGPRLTNILLRECVIILEFWIRPSLDYALEYLRFRVRGVKVHDRKRHTRIAQRVIAFEGAPSVMTRMKSPSRPSQTGAL